MIGTAWIEWPQNGAKSRKVEGRAEPVLSQAEGS